MTWTPTLVPASLEPGTSVSFEQYVRTHAASLVGFARRISGDYHRGEDLVQEVLARCANRWPQISAGNPDAYLHRAIVNEYLCLRRRRWVTEMLYDTMDSGGVPEPASGEPAAVDLIADAEVWRAALARLPDRQRIVLVMRYFLDWPDEEIARAMRCPPATVRSHARRGLQRLRGSFPEYRPGES